MRLKNRLFQANFGIQAQMDEYVIALAGNPNVGKSTIFNALTGLRQHTGNWAGKTVTNAQGKFRYREKSFLLVDLPGTYSLLAQTADEKIARDFICFGGPDAVATVLDAACLERNLNLVLQVMEITPNVIVCVNLIDEAVKKGIGIDFAALEKELGVPVVACCARRGEGIKDLREVLWQVSTGKKMPEPRKLKYSQAVEDLVREIEPSIKSIVRGKLNSRWVALRMLDSDQAFIESINFHLKRGEAAELDGGQLDFS
ncbi:MAG: 50S ribosome-binding GTPase [Sporomusaceae bacterium]|jgi:Fe2+ transport system protein B|nr:50S ribosome-binding GTPase [Sporomusaceae bacterium]